MGPYRRPASVLSPPALSTALSTVLTSVRAPCRRQLARARLLVLVVTLFVRVEVGLRRHALPDVCRRLGVALGDELPDLATTEVPSRDWLARRVRAVHRVGRHWPYGDTCLRRCLVLGSLLRRTGPTLVLGVRRGSGSSVEAHAWLEIGGRPVDPTSSSYAVLAR